MNTETATVTCDESFTAPVILPCQEDSTAIAVLMVSYDGSLIDCGGTLSVSEAAEVPTVQVRVVDNEDEDDMITGIIADTLYTLLLVDTTSTPGDEASSMGVHPILHYGAVNIPGSALLDGISLDDDSLVDNSIFSYYAGPSPPKAEDPWSTPEIQQTLFVYEYMLIAQPEKINFTELLLDFGTNVMRFDYEQFVEETVGSSFDNVISTYFQSGRCLSDGTETVATAAAATSTTVLIESFDDPKFYWESFTMDDAKMEDMKGMQDQYDFDFSNYDNEIKDSSEYDAWNMEGQQNNWNNTSTKGSSMVIVDGIMILTANISGDGMGDTVTMMAGGKFPDLSTCDGLQVSFSFYKKHYCCYFVKRIRYFIFIFIICFISQLNVHVCSFQKKVRGDDYPTW